MKYVKLTISLLVLTALSSLNAWDLTIVNKASNYAIIPRIMTEKWLTQAKSYSLPDSLTFWGLRNQYWNNPSKQMNPLAVNRTNTFPVDDKLTELKFNLAVFGPTISGGTKEVNGAGFTVYNPEKKNATIETNYSRLVGALGNPFSVESKTPGVTVKQKEK
jgi:hypothetical protein